MATFEKRGNFWRAKIRRAGLPARSNAHQAGRRRREPSAQGDGAAPGRAHPEGRAHQLAPRGLSR